jgi:hypothetical protein
MGLPFLIVINLPLEDQVYTPYLFLLGGAGNSGQKNHETDRISAPQSSLHFSLHVARQKAGGCLFADLYVNDPTRRRLSAYLAYLEGSPRHIRPVLSLFVLLRRNSKALVWRGHIYLLISNGKIKPGLSP